MSVLQMYARPDRDEIAAGLGIAPGDYSTYPPLAADPVAAGTRPKPRAPRQRRDAGGLPGPRPRARTAPPPPRRSRAGRTGAAPAPTSSTAPATGSPAARRSDQ